MCYYEICLDCFRSRRRTKRQAVLLAPALQSVEASSVSTSHVGAITQGRDDCCFRIDALDSTSVDKVDSHAVFPNRDRAHVGISEHPGVHVTVSLKLKTSRLGRLQPQFNAVGISAIADSGAQTNMFGPSTSSLVVDFDNTVWFLFQTWRLPIFPLFPLKKIL